MRIEGFLKHMGGNFREGVKSATGLGCYLMAFIAGSFGGEWGFVMLMLPKTFIIWMLYLMLK